MSDCEYDGCDQPVIFRAYASYNADHGENVHPLHARYPAAMIRACGNHVGRLMLHDADSPNATRQWLVVVPLCAPDEVNEAHVLSPLRTVPLGGEAECSCGHPYRTPNTPGRGGRRIIERMHAEHLADSVPARPPLRIPPIPGTETWSGP